MLMCDDGSLQVEISFALSHSHRDSINTQPTVKNEVFLFFLSIFFLPFQFRHKQFDVVIFK